MPSNPPMLAFLFSHQTEYLSLLHNENITDNIYLLVDLLPDNVDTCELYIKTATFTLENEMITKVPKIPSFATRRGVDWYYD